MKVFSLEEKSFLKSRPFDQALEPLHGYYAEIDGFKRIGHPLNL